MELVWFLLQNLQNHYLPNWLPLRYGNVLEI